jgi:glycine oxidase
MSKYDVIIIGGGIIGSSIAYEFSKRNKKVAILERNRLASEASGAAAGMLAAQVEMGLEVGPLFNLAIQSREMFPRLSEELRQISGIDIGLVNKGMLKIPQTPDEAKCFDQIIKVQSSLGHEVKWNDGAMEVSGDGEVDAPSLSMAFAKSAEILAAAIREFAEVNSFIFEEDKVVGVKTLGGDFYADQTVVAAGAWSGHLLAKAELQLKLHPVKGECFSVLANRPLLEATLFSHGCYIVPKKGNRLLVGATMIPNTFDKKVSFQSINSLMEKAKKLLPAIENTEWEKAWSGIRPQTEDGLPYLGLHPKYQNLAIATGHYRNGILLSGITGVLIADLLEGKLEEDLSPFRVDRRLRDEFDH